MPGGMWCLGMWFSGRLGSVGLMLGLYDPKGLVQPERFYDSIMGERRVYQLPLLAASY